MSFLMVRPLAAPVDEPPPPPPGVTPAGMMKQNAQSAPGNAGFVQMTGFRAIAGLAGTVITNHELIVSGSGEAVITARSRAESASILMAWRIHINGTEVFAYPGEDVERRETRVLVHGDRIGLWFGTSFLGGSVPHDGAFIRIGPAG